ncbi:MAG: NTP transferase domain-containing protein, partial [Chitinophagaceae bacterium]|nr:NTP transferase domain-containing protein [Chitinophagaceae bacterium]
MISEVIILAGGLGTRLRDAVSDVPKCMAPVAGRPFLSFVIDYLRMQNVQRFIFSLGYKGEIIGRYLQEYYPTLNYKTVIEDEPLGTGGAIRLAIQHIKSEDMLIANGDTLFKVDVSQLEQTHLQKKAECTLALKPLMVFDRYGVVETNAGGRIISFREKKFYESGLINGGIYILNKSRFLQHSFPYKFSFEKDYLEKFCNTLHFYGVVQERYFIDIGVPEDYQKSQLELQNSELDLTKIDKSWTLFLDRDGVINEERVGEYVLNWRQFIFSEGVLKVFKILSEKFGRIIIISNQRGVGKHLM